MLSETYAADLRGAFIAFGVAAAVVGLLAATFAFRLRRSSRGLSRGSALALTFIALAAVGTAYWWLFLDTYYRVRATEEAVELRLVLPDRDVRIPRAEVARFAIEPAPRGTARLVIETTSGHRYYSPPAPRTNRVDAAERLGNMMKPDMNQIAERYVRLVLQVGLHDTDFVDAYYGPQEFRPAEGATPRPLDTLVAEAAFLLADAEAVDPGASPDELSRLRQRYLVDQLRAVHTRLRMLEGERFDFEEESRLLYGAEAPVNTEASFQSVLDELESLLPGDGPLIERYDAFRSRFVVPRARLDRVFTTAIDECRRRTREHLALPEDEAFTVEYVTGKSWSAYNWYQGGFQSLIQVNTDLPITIDRAIDLACHEGYPGHHVYNVLLEQRLVRERRWIEFSVYPLFSPQSLIAEGTANFGIEMAFPGGTRIDWERDVLFPAAGLDPAGAERYYDVQARVERLAYAGNEAARRYLNGDITREQAVAWLERYAMMPRDRAEQRTRFFDQYRSYVINYNLGRDLVRAWVDREAPDGNRWPAFERLLSSPRLPSSLR